jgi:glycosyltransferase involved in cell wall biosynthesis
MAPNDGEDDGEEPMKILWLRPDKPENVSVGRHRLGLELERRGHEVEIRNTTSAQFRQILGEDPDIVVGTTRLGAFVGAWKRVVSGTPLVVDHIDPIAQLRRYHGPVTTWGVDKAEKLTFRLADHVMVVYEEELPRVHRHASKVTHTSLGVDYDLFADPPEETIQSARRSLAERLPDGTNVVLYVGGLEPPYHLSAVVNAVALLDDWHFVVLGDGSQRNWLEEVAAAEDAVHYLGTMPYEEVAGYMHTADVGVNLIDDQNTLKVLEYGAAGLPVVHVEGEGEQVFDGMMVFCSLESSNVARAIEEAGGSNTSALEELARRRSWKSIADAYEAVLQPLVETKS